MFRMFKSLTVSIVLAAAGCGIGADADDSVTQSEASLLATPNDFGTAETFHVTGVTASNLVGPAYQSASASNVRRGVCETALIPSFKRCQPIEAVREQ